MVLVPFVLLRLYELYKTKSFQVASSAQELVITSLFVLLPLPRCLWIPISLSLFLRWYVFFRYQAEVLSFLRAPRCFFDSIKEISIKKPLCISFFLSYVSYSFQSPPCDAFWIPLFLISLFFSFPRRKKSPLPALSFPNEISSLIMPQYPALRKTHIFLGKKRIHLTVDKPHIIFIFLESFRAKNVGCLGATIPASPHFDQWAKKGILFRNFHANGLQTFRAFMSAYFGIPGHLRTVSLKPFCSLSLFGLPQILKKQGYHPAIIQSGDLSFDHLYPFFKKHGFETLIGAEDIPGPRTSSWGIDDESMVRFAAAWLEKQKDPTFLSLFTITNHHPWKLPSDHHGHTEEIQVPSSIALLRELASKRTMENFAAPQYHHFLQTFAYTDHCLNLFLESINLDNSIVFIAGDHGQEMGERRPYSEKNHSLYEENIHLPLLILGKTGTPQVIDDNASFVDFLPTVLDMLKLKETHHSLGKSLLREIHTPTYFSMHREDLQIGALLGKKKVIVPKGFDLEHDPDEQIDIGPTLRDLSLQCKSHFQDVLAIMQANAWAPPQEQFALTATSDMTEDTWLSHVKKYPHVSVIDLSSGHLSDFAITKTNPTSWHQVTLRDCTRITDQSLIWMSKHCKKLMWLDLSHCHLLSDDGVRHILSPSLRHLWLDGIDLNDFVPSDISLNLRTFSLKNMPRLNAQSLMSLYANSPHLISWSATLTHVKNQDLIAMSQYKKRSTNMFLSDGIYIQDGALSQLLDSQEELQEIHLEHFPLLENPNFSKLKKLRYLTITTCPRLNSSFFASLKTLPIQIHYVS